MILHCLMEKQDISTQSSIPLQKISQNMFTIDTDVEHKKWEIVDPGFEKGIDPAVWDVKGNLIACIVETVDRENRTVTVINATTFSKIAQIDGNFRERESHLISASWLFSSMLDKLSRREMMKVHLCLALVAS